MSEHIVQPRIYIGIFLSLMVGTALTVLAAFYDFPGPLNAVVALTIAAIKATLVVLYFMHVRYSGRLVWLVIVAALLWLRSPSATIGPVPGCRRCSLNQLSQTRHTDVARER